MSLAARHTPADVQHLPVPRGRQPKGSACSAAARPAAQVPYPLDLTPFATMSAQRGRLEVNLLCAQLRDARTFGKAAQIALDLHTSVVAAVSIALGELDL